MDAARQAAVTLDHVTKRYAAVTALQDVTLNVMPGEMFGLIGPDGAGKTTTIRLIAGLIPATSGSVRVFNHDPVADHRSVVTDIGYLSQRFSLYGDLSIDENIAFFAEVHGVADYRPRRDRLLELTQLHPFRDRLADQLSGGMKQKLALTCTLIHEPRLLLLDEPTTGVDPVSRREFWKLLSEFLAQGMTIVMATPYLDEAERCRRVALLHNGGVLALDDPSRLRATYPGRILQIIASPYREAALLLAALFPPNDVQSFGERTHVRLGDEDVEVAKARIEQAFAGGGVALKSARLATPSLEDVFIERLIS
ncbi:MAG: ATP-binding cassette domain-containing protein [Luteitalea sp.]|nr:ATP-binding cassette domain-containing protein [Luteitalea sp.]